MTLDRLLFALAGLAEKAFTRLAVAALPRSSRSQHEAYWQGYRDGLRDADSRTRLLGPGR